MLFVYFQEVCAIFNILKTPFGTHAAFYLHSFSTLKTPFGTHAACYLHSFNTLKTPFGTHAACYSHSFCILKKPFVTQGPRSAPMLPSTNSFQHPSCLLFT